MATTDCNLDIHFEDNHLLVVNKPALLPTMGVAEDQNSLAKQAKQYLKQKYDKPGNVYLGVVSRLDSHTSGLLVFARTSKAAGRLNEQFRAGTVVKRYLAIVPDSVPERGVWKDHLWKNDSRHQMQVVEDDHPQFRQSQLASLEFEKIESNVDACLAVVDVRLHSGRKHQIRVQFSSRGFPIVGDRKYNSPDRFQSGIALHSCFLEFEHPTKREPLRFTANPPSYWPFDRAIHYHLNQLGQDEL